MPIPLLAVAGAAAGLQAVGGIVQTITGNNRANDLKAQLKPYKTPKELEKILQATQAQMSDTSLLDYASGEINKNTATTLNTAMKLGANPNDLSAILGIQVDKLIKVGEDQHQQNMANFGRYLDSLQLLGESKDAERISKNNLIKDELQQAATDKAQGVQNIGNAINSFVGAYAADQTGKQYTDKPVADYYLSQGRTTSVSHG